ncbi:MAG: pyridoxamine 5'-phosphate oxidase family protein [Actinophytocola sp.]|uniref:pyridoxamine 5'-phosphate oxidase family protein n=1 Tax=Actinophytocola sp. TaxID=1872138 RepID=UPI001329029C|nr:pyridoxamine 5'-phosphate oxidase family protein [Actinophytocola sp.]MPZ84362.1 pyridoxamine 5'-phosphate oxidase family protein [Actinophytocola sp.]
MMVTEPSGQYISEFSEPGSTAVPWADVEQVLRESEMFWLSTVRRDGRPHVAPLPAMWLDGKLHFCTGAHEQKARNIESNPRCVLTTGSSSYRSGIDVVVEGTVAQVSDEPTLTRLAQMWRDELDWPFEVVDGQFRDPGADDHRAPVFAVTPAKVLVFGKAPYSQTRYTFQAS